ncbi:hypothetical protein PR003_g23438, partial [Phytophthora rubi]
MVKLFCAVVGVAGSAFEVDIDEVASVSALKKAIKEEKKNKLDKVDADALQLFLAKKDGAWLKDDDPAALELEEGNTHQDIQTLIDGEKMKATWTIEDVLTANNMTKRKGRAPKSRQIHVLVAVPEQENDRFSTMALGVAPSLPPTTIHRHPERLKRWSAINAMIRQKNQEANQKTTSEDAKKTNKKRKNHDVDKTVGYS